MLAVFLGLLLFGIIYNGFVTWLEEHGHDRGYTAILVVGGTLVTLTGSGILIGWRDIGTVLLCFAASGAPMVAGSIWRHVQQRARDESTARSVVQALFDDNGDAT